MSPDRRLAERGADQTFFEAAIMPHRSLGRRGLAVVAALLVAGSVLVATVAWRDGAWPVLGFAAAELALALALLARNAGEARAAELILLAPSGLRLVRIDRRGRRSERRLPVDWLNVMLEERRGRVPLLRLGARGQGEEVAASLGEAEKRLLAEALREALHRWRNPRFDTPAREPE